MSEECTCQYYGFPYYEISKGCPRHDIPNQQSAIHQSMSASAIQPSEIPDDVRLRMEVDKWKARFDKLLSSWEIDSAKLKSDLTEAVRLLRECEPMTDECSGLFESLNRRINAFLAKHKEQSK